MTLSIIEFIFDPNDLFYSWWFYGYLNVKLGNLLTSSSETRKNWACAKKHAQANKKYRHAPNREMMQVDKQFF